MPKMVEIDEEELLTNRRLRETLQKIVAHPEARLLAERAHKLIDPKAATPGLDQQTQLVAPLQEMTKKVDEFIAAQKKQREEEDAERKLSSLKRQQDDGIAQLRRDGYTDEGIAGIKKLMDDKGILDPVDAAAIFDRLHPPQVPITPNGTGQPWNFLAAPESDTDIKALIESKGENVALLDKMIADGLNEYRGAQPRR